MVGLARLAFAGLLAAAASGLPALAHDVSPGIPRIDLTPKDPRDPAGDGGVVPLRPLTAQEMALLAQSVSRCMVLPGQLAGQTDLTIVLSVDFDPLGRVVGSPHLVEPADSDAPEVRIVFEMLRRALLRCQGTGYVLPREIYPVWKTVEFTFSPKGMLKRW